MFQKLLTISIVLLYTNEVSASYLLDEKNFHKMKMERNNKVNTGVWKRGGERSDTKVYHGDFLFPGAPVEVESLSGVVGDFADNNNNMNNDVDSSAANYFSRFKRGANKSDKRDASACRGDETNCVETTEGTTRTTKVKSEFISKLKPATVFNEYPYEIAVLLNDDLNEIVKQADNNDINKSNDVELKVLPLADGKDYVDIYVTPTDRIVDINEIYAKLREAANHTINTIDYTMKPNDYETEAIKNIILTDKVNGSDENGKANRNNIIMGIFNKEHQAWPQKPPKIDKKNSEANIVVPKAKSTIVSKTINGEGLIKVLSMLTKTFKKIMKQHENIRKIHGKFYDANNDFTKKIDEMKRMFQEFEEKYNLVIQLSNKIVTTETKMEAKFGQIEADHKKLTKNLADFVEHQQKFVLQQKQFYDIQRAILAQNEDISQKQTLIARSQNLVSHKQNEFARIIQKIKKLYNSRKNAKLSPNVKVKSQQKANDVTTTMKPTVKPNIAKTTESVKINLFSIPVKEKLKNQDENILSVRDEQSIDDIVYKFYFNNTFIDNLLKTGILGSFVNEPNTAGHKNIEKRSREEIDKLLEKTVLLPVADTAASNKRERRWISRTDHKNKRTQAKPPVANRFKHLDDNETQHKKRRSHKLAHSKLNVVNATDKKVDAEDQTVMEKLNFEKKSYVGERNNPYRLMATNFCNQIKQNTSSQILNWCIEKALRKLKAIDVAMALQPSGGLKEDRHLMAGDNVEQLAKSIHTFRKFRPSETPHVLTPTELTPTGQSSVQGPSIIGENTSPSSTQPRDTMAGMFFPDNDQLESNLKQYELVPDNEGTVFFDGSVHSSKMVPGTDDEAASDVMPGMDSNSHVEIDPHALEIQAQRRAYVRSFNANLLKNAKNQ